MSYEVDVHLKDAESWLARLDKEFQTIHDMNFTSECNFLYVNGQQVSSELCRHEHGIYLCAKEKCSKPFEYTHLDLATGKSKECVYVQPEDFESFIYIPCHWDYEHMVQTEKDICLAAKRVGIEVTTHLSW